MLDIMHLHATAIKQVNLTQNHFFLNMFIMILCVAWVQGLWSTVAWRRHVMSS
jgi:hypothetical protein